ncbi:MAG: hypothetical protein R3F30_03380 [Planctomycetota bacterium]
MTSKHHHARTARASGILSVLALLAGPCPAQTTKVVWQTDNKHTLEANAFPWGSQGVRYQTIIDKAVIGGSKVRIQDVMVSGVQVPAEIQYADIEIRMGATGESVPVADWTRNNPASTTVYRGPMRIRFVPGQWNGIGLPLPFDFTPTTARPNLCFEVIVWKALVPSTFQTNFYFPQSDTQIHRAYLYRWVQGGGASNTTAPDTSSESGAKIGLLLEGGAFVTVGTGCTGSGSNQPLAILSPGAPTQGTKQTVHLTGALPGSHAMLCFGVTLGGQGPVTLPLELGPYGAPNCVLWVPPVHVAGAVVDATGAARHDVVIPPGTAGFRVFLQWWDLDAKANALGLTFSDYATLIVGR